MPGRQVAALRIIRGAASTAGGWHEHLSLHAPHGDRHGRHVSHFLDLVPNNIGEPCGFGFGGTFHVDHSGHEPSSKEGAVIFVKLRQMRPQEQQSVRIDTRAAASWHSEEGREVCPLFSDDIEQTSLQRLALGEAVFTAAVDGAELLVLTGNVVMDGESYERGGWIRLPAGQYPGIVAGAQGTTVYLKIGRLGETPVGA